MTTKQKLLSGLVAFIVLVCVFAAFSSNYTVDEGERGVVLRFGKFHETANPGLNWKVPFIDEVKTLSIRPVTSPYPNLKAYSFDQQSAEVSVSVTYSIPEGEVESLYSNYTSIHGFESTVLNRIVPDQLETILGQYNAITAVQSREKLGSDLENAIRKSVLKTNSGVFIQGVQLENIDFSDAYEESVEQRMQAEVAVETQNQNLEKEKVSAQIEVTRAQALADSQLAQAEAAAKAKRLDGEAEAAAIEAKGRALAQTPGLVEYTKASRWDGKLPTTMLPDSTLPFFNTDKLATQ